jgi:hypothetical protein
MFQYPLQTSIIAGACVALIVSACGSNDVAAIDATVSPLSAKYLADTVLPELSLVSGERQGERENARSGLRAGDARPDAELLDAASAASK